MTEKAKKSGKGRANKTNPHTGARKTANNKRRILDYLDENGDFVTTACRKLNLSRTQFYKWLNEDSDFAARYNDIKEKHNDLMEANLTHIAFNAERESDRISATKAYLSARAKDRGYGVEKREQKHSGEIQTTSQPIIVKLPDNGRRTFSETTKPIDV